MSATLGLSAYRWNNNIKSAVLLAVFPLLFLGLVGAYFYIVGRSNAHGTGYLGQQIAAYYGHISGAAAISIESFAIERTLSLLPLVTCLAISWILIGSIFNEALIRISTRAKKLERSAAPDVYNALENLCILRGLRMPKLYMIDSTATNAFASGLNERSYAITVTRGLVEKLEKDEIEAVLAHELTHILNNDARLLVITALFANLLLFVPQTIMSVTRTVGSITNDEGDNPFIIVIAFILFRIPIALFILSTGYAISSFFRLALSRQREFQADQGAVEMTKRPESLIKALEKIEADADLPYLPCGVQAMLIQNPPGWLSLFDTHPPLAQRIDILRKLSGLAAPVADASGPAQAKGDLS